MGTAAKVVCSIDGVSGLMYTDSVYCMSGHTATVDVDTKAVVCCAFCVVAVSGLVCVAGDLGMWPLLLWRRDEWRDVVLPV